MLGETISYSQGAFVRDRQILDAVIEANEAMEEYEKAKDLVLFTKLTLRKLMITSIGNF